MISDSENRANLDDPSAYYGLNHAPRAPLPIATGGDQSLVLDAELVDRSPSEIAQILADRDAHREGCDDEHCSRCSQVNDRTLRGDHETTGGGSGGGRKQRKKSGGGFSNTEPAMAHVYENEIERDLRPRNVAGRVSNETYAALFADGNPSVGEMLEAIGRALHRRVTWESIANAIGEL